MKINFFSAYIFLTIGLSLSANGICNNFTVEDQDCRSMSDAKKRLECFDSESSSSPDIKPGVANKSLSKDSYKRFENVFRSASKIAGATEAGVTYVRFSELLGDLAGEVAFLENESHTALEQEAVNILKQSVEIYRDSLTLWTDVISANSNRSMQLQQDYVIFGFYPNTAAITQKYSLPWTKDTSFFSGPDSIYGPGARSALWDKAATLIVNTRQALRDSQ